MLNVIVCVKAVPDPDEEHQLRIDPASGALLRGDVPLVVNPSDRNALEAAVQLKEQDGGHVTVLSMGPPPAANVVRECLALGADDGILLCDPALAGADAYATAYTLAKAIEKIGEYDVIFCGMASSDGATEWVGPEIAAFLNVPVVTRVQALGERGSEWWHVEASLEDGYRVVRVALPAVLTATRDLNVPRKLGFSGIVAARKKSITEWCLDDLGVPEDAVGLKGSPTIVSHVMRVESRREVTVLEGTREEKASELVHRLANNGFI
jgi:electron transfer flavoprotein beta subunit